MVLRLSFNSLSYTHTHDSQALHELNSRSVSEQMDFIGLYEIVCLVPEWFTVCSWQACVFVDDVEEKNRLVKETNISLIVLSNTQNTLLQFVIPQFSAFGSKSTGIYPKKLC